MLLLLAVAGSQPASESPPVSTPPPAVSSTATLPGGDSPEWRMRMLGWSATEETQGSPKATLVMEKPVATGRLSSTFGTRTDPVDRGWRAHRGVDIAGPMGTSVVASMDGIVTFAGSAGGYGGMVQIDHADGLQVRYGHLSRILARRGDLVHRGDVIGAMGSTGRSTGSHLHYEIRVNGSAVDPMRPLPAPAYLRRSLPSTRTGPPSEQPPSIVQPAGPVASDQSLPAAYR